MKLKDRLKSAEQAALSSGVVGKLFSFFQGRATAFAIVFTIVGCTLAFKGKLDANFALFVTAIQGLVFAHSLKQDYFDNQIPPNTTVVVEDKKD